MKKLFILGIGIFILLVVITTIITLTSKSDAFREEKIVFVMDNNEHNGFPDIFSIDTDGKNLTNLTNHPEFDAFPAPSPDDRFIAFISSRNGRPGIYIMDADGKSPRLLLESRDVNDKPSWSPDSRWIAFSGKENVLLAVNIKTGEQKEIFRLAGVGSLTGMSSWSPDGQKIVFRMIFVKPNDGGDIYTIDIHSKELTQLTKDPANDEYPAWSPDGKQIAFSSSRDGGGIFVMDADGANIKQIHNVRGCCPSWSRDGKKIAFSSKGGIFVMNSDRSSLKEIFNPFKEKQISAKMPSWLGLSFNVESESKWKTIWGKIKQDF